MNRFSVLTAPGLEGITERELQGLGLAPERSLVPGMPPLSFTGNPESLYRASLHLRTATRILATVGMPFFARSFDDLTKRAAHLPWKLFLAPDRPVSLRVDSRGSKLYHEEAVAERIAACIAERVGSPRERGQKVEGSQARQVFVHVIEDRCTVSVDSSGEPLHRRGYRLETAKAPLREDLAAAILMACEWDGTSPLIDPFCGSGTIPIEAALLSRHVAPGLSREHFAFMDWPAFDADLWRRLRSEAAEARLPPSQGPLILASDRDAGALRIAQANMERAGITGGITFACQAVSALLPPSDSRGWVVTNPPYGHRVSEGKDLRNLYAQLGNVLREKCGGWHAGILSSSRALLGHTGLGLDLSFTFNHGGLEVILGRGEIVQRE